MSGGIEKEKEVISAIERVTGKPAASTASSLMDAFDALGVKRLVFISETLQEGHDKKMAFLKDAGLEIVSDKAMGLAGSDVYCSTPSSYWYENVKALRNDQAEAYFVSCANIHSINIIEDLEDVLGRPVITSNQSALWSALRIAGVKDDISSLGRLFQCR